MQFHPSGFRIAGRYEVAGAPLLGGMGIVYFCFDHQEQRPVALKSFRPEFLPDRAARERFLQEDEIWVRLGKHPHIVRCYQVFQDSPRPEVYLALELIAKEEGRRDASLRSFLIPGRPLPIDQALLIALQIVRGMKHATETIPGFVHRDLKPENVLVGADRLSNAAINRVRVTDFGLVKGLRSEQVPAAAIDFANQPGRLTQVGSVVGTPLYMAPEQWAGADVAVQADVYALGCILGEMATGRPLVQGKTQDELRRAHQGGQALAAARAAPAVLADLLSRCLATEPAQRYADWGAVEEALVAAYGAATGQPPPEPEPAAGLSRAERVAIGWSFNAIGYSYVEIGRAEVALQYLERVRLAGQLEKEPRLELAGLNHLGLANQALGDSKLAIVYHENALYLARQIEDRVEQANNLNGLGKSYRAIGDLRQAEACFEGALVAFQSVGGHLGMVNTLTDLGDLYRTQRRFQEATESLTQAREIATSLNDVTALGYVLNSMGLVYTDLKDWTQAINCHEGALVIARDNSDLDLEANALNNLGNAHIGQGDTNKAITYLELALAIYRETGAQHREGTTLNNIGAYYLKQREPRRAIVYFEQAQAILRKIGDIGNLAMVFLNMAMAYIQQSNPACALPLAREAARLYSQAGNSAYTQRAQQLVAQLESRSLGTGPGPDEMLRQFAMVISAAVAATHGDRNARSQLEAAFNMFTQKGWRIAEPICRIWAGQRDEAALTAGIDANSALIVREILRRL